MGISIGSIVEVSFASAHQEETNPAGKLNGQRFVVKKRKALHVTDKTTQYLYELYGAESDKGIPYGFTEDNLIELDVIKGGEK